MVHVTSAFLVLSAVEGRLYANYRSAHCDVNGHGGVPLPGTQPLKNATSADCVAACDDNADCVGFSREMTSGDWRSPYGDCYLRSELVISECDYSDRRWSTYMQAPLPPLTGNIAYHLFERKYTGLANRDAGDFKGDTGFIFATFTKYVKGNPEASMDHNIIEMSEFNVTGWGRYEECNAPGAVGMFTCPETATDYCCTTFDASGHHIPANHTKTQLPGVETNFYSLGVQYGFPGYWYSFPLESENVAWTQKTLRRVEGKCLGNAWRADAGGCSKCGTDLDECVADCIKAALTADGKTDAIQKTWDRVFSDASECPDVPLPTERMVVV